MAVAVAKHRVKKRAWAVELLGGCCAVCGRSDLPMDFDHIDPATKSFVISTAIRNGCSKAKLEAELLKCQLLCIPHHEAKTWVEHVCGMLTWKINRSGTGAVR